MELYKICDEIACFDWEVDEETGEILNGDAFDKLKLERDEKVENICLYIKNLKSDAEQLKKEKEAFAKRQKEAENRAEWLKGYLLRNLNGKKFKTDKCDISYRKSETVHVPDDLSKLDWKYCNQKIVADKIAIKNAIKSGEKVDGCYMEEHLNLIIK